MTTTTKKSKALSANKGITVDAILRLKLANPDLTTTQAAKILGCTKQTICHHIKHLGYTWTNLLDEIADVERVKGLQLKVKQQQVLEAMSTDKLKQANAQQLATVFGILVDKQRLIDGESTQNISTFSHIVMAACDDQPGPDEDRGEIEVGSGDTSSDMESGDGSVQPIESIKES